MHLRKALLQAGTEIEEVLKRQVRMQSANDVEFSDGLGISGGGRFESLLERHGVSAGRVFLAAKGTKAAGRDTNVGGVNVAVDVEIRLVAIHALAHQVGHPAHGENVARAVKPQGVVSVKPFAGHHLGMDRGEPRVVGLKRMGWARGRHLSHDIAEWIGTPSATGGSSHLAVGPACASQARTRFPLTFRTKTASNHIANCALAPAEGDSHGTTSRNRNSMHSILMWLVLGPEPNAIFVRTERHSID